MTALPSGFEPATKRAKLLCGCLWLHSGRADLTIVSGALLRLYADRLETLNDLVIQAFIASAMIRMLVGGLLHLATFLFFIVWLMRTLENLRYLEAGPLRFGRFSAVVSFFIPGLFFVLPPYFLRTAWYGSDPSRLVAERRQNWPEAWRAPWSVVLWWACFWAYLGVNSQTQERWPKLSGMFGRWPAGTVQYAETTGWLELGTGACYLAATLMTIRMVRQITQWQDQRHEKTIEMLMRPSVKPS